MVKNSETEFTKLKFTFESINSILSVYKISRSVIYNFENVFFSQGFGILLNQM